MHRSIKILLLALVGLFLLAGCQQKPRTTADVPRVLSPRYSIAVMPFSQPTEACDLIMGHLPDNQGCIPPDQTMLLDADLRELLQSRQNGRNISYAANLPAFLLNQGTRFRASSEPQALEGWAKFARQTGKDFVLVPYIIDWRERDGGPAGVSKAASVHIEFYLIRSDTGTIHEYQVFNETQEGLTSNLLNVGDFFKRKATWVTARELAKEGMAVMLSRMGLLSPYQQTAPEAPAEDGK